jgi:hypothetical protein
VQVGAGRGFPALLPVSADEAGQVGTEALHDKHAVRPCERRGLGVEACQKRRPVLQASSWLQRTARC